MSNFQELSHAIVRRAPGSANHRGLMQIGHRTIPCAIGRNGSTAIKREGDWATPLGILLRPQMIYFRADRVKRPRGMLPAKSTNPDDGWCDEPLHPQYNQPVSLPFASSHEKMMRDDGLYDYCVVLDFNRAPKAQKRFGGSAIFLHCAKPGFQPTAGCIAIERDMLERLCARITRRTVFLMAN
ncbi:MAG: L,D-transpeptidase family protein [Pseudomonadota bacterium]